MSIIVSILSTFNAKGLTAAEKRTKAFNQTVKALGTTMAATFGAQRITQFAKASIKAFADEDKAVRALSLNLSNLGLAYDVKPIEAYIDSLQRSTGVADSELRPAFQQLANATRDLATSQEILGVALDISAATGKSVAQVTQGLSRAYLGNTTSLGRLNIGISKADLSAKSFDDILAELSNRFSGQAAAAATTYTGKINRLKIAADEAQEILGEKLVTAIDMLGEGRGGVAELANEFERMATYVGNIAVGIAAFTKDLEKLSGGTVSASAFSPANLIKAGLSVNFPGAKAALDLLQQRAAKENAKQALIERNARKDSALAANRTLKATTETTKQLKEQGSLTKAKSILDLEKIQIEAALQGELTDNERLRLQLMKAVANENVDRATTLAAKLAESQTELSKLQRLSVEFKPSNPFEVWLDAIERMRQGLASIGAPVASISGATSSGTALSVTPSLGSTGEMEVAPGAFITPEFFGRQTGVQQININVSGTGDLSDDTKRKIVETIIDASSIGYSTSGWYRTTGNVAL